MAARSELWQLNALRRLAEVAISWEELQFMRRLITGLSALALSMGVVLVPHAFAQAKPSITVLSPKAGDTITSTDIPVTVQVSNFTLSPADVGLPDYLNAFLERGAR